MTSRLGLSAARTRHRVRPMFRGNLSNQHRLLATDLASSHIIDTLRIPSFDDRRRPLYTPYTHSVPFCALLTSSFLSRHFSIAEQRPGLPSRAASADTTAVREPCDRQNICGEGSAVYGLRRSIFCTEGRGWLLLTRCQLLQ
jgi:hypothetical protein